MKRTLRVACGIARASAIGCALLAYGAAAVAATAAAVAVALVGNAVARREA